MITTTYGYRKPESGDLAKKTNGWFESMEFNVTRFDAHSHDGADSVALSFSSITPYSGVVIGPLTFQNSDVNDSDETIEITGHGFIASGAPVVYTEGSGNTITNLTDAATYYVIYDTADKIKLATSEANALLGTAINITDAVDNSTDNTINPWVVDGVGYKQTITVPAGIDDINNYNAKFVFTAPAGNVGEMAYLEYEKVTATTYDVYCNDNTTAFSVVYR